MLKHQQCQVLILTDRTTSRKHLCWGLFSIILQAFRPATLLKRDSNTGVFLQNLRKYLRTPI